MAESTSLSQASSPPGSPLKTINPLSKHELRAERRSVLKLDFTVLPLVGMIYCLINLNRTNLGNARIVGLEHDLHFTDLQYQICVTILFLPYIAVELPSNLLLRKIGAGFLMPMLITILGVMVTLQGFTTSYGGLVTARAFIGLVEGPVYPAIILYLSGFYTRKELSLRIAIFFSPIPLWDLLSTPIGFVIYGMNGMGGRPGWAWIFILEGLFTVSVGLISFFVVPSTPCDSKFLTRTQKDIVMTRLERDRPFINSVETFSIKEVLRSVSSPHVIMVSIMSFLNGAMLYGLPSFYPYIVQQLRFGFMKTILLNIGPFATAAILLIFFAIFSDRYNSRGITTALVSIITVVGYAIFLGVKRKLIKYAALYLIVTGVYTTSPLLAAWMANNSEPHYRRGTSIALFSMMSSAGGILSAWSFPLKEAPEYRKTATINLVFAILLVLGSLVNMAYLSRRNRLKKRPEERARLLEKYTESDREGNSGGLKAWMELGDRHPDFVYIL